MYLWMLLRSNPIVKYAVLIILAISIICAQEYRVSSKVKVIEELKVSLAKSQESSLQKSIISESRKAELESCASTLARVVSEVKSLEANPIVVEKIIYKAEQVAKKSEDKVVEIRKAAVEQASNAKTVEGSTPRVVEKETPTGSCVDVKSLKLIQDYIKDRQTEVNK